MKDKILVLIFLFLTALTYAQTITGKVSDALKEPLIGVSVVVEGKRIGTTTDFDGNYTISAKRGDVLKFTYVGLQTKTVTVGADTVINVTMEEDATALNEVVITALGIKKAKRSVGYSVQELGADQIAREGSQDVLSALQGKIAGVTINATGGAAGAGSNILIRGVTSLNASGDNQPLFVVDGVPISNLATSGSVLPSTGSNSPSSSEQFSYTNRGADINPDDIETISVLKGPAATALYGLRAANGVVLITTKRGKSGQMQFNFRTSAGWSEVGKTPEVQTRWREGFSGVAISSDDPAAPTGYSYAPGNTFGFWSFGPEYGPNDRFYNNFRDFFRKGFSSSNTLNVNGGGKNYTYFGSISRSDEDGIVPNTFFSRTTAKLSGIVNISEKFSVEPSVSYILSDGRLPNGGDKSIMSSLSYWSPTINVNDYLTVNGTEKNYSNGVVDNPRYFAEVSALDSRVNRLLGNIKFNYNITNWLNVQYQLGIDNYHDNRVRFVPPDIDAGTAVQGFIVHQGINYNELTSNLFVTLSRDFNENLKGSFLVGNQVTDIETRSLLSRAEGLDPTDLKNFEAATNFFGDRRNTERNLSGVFGDLRLEYKNTLFLSVTGRNDWSSTLPKANRSFFYPSASLSYVLSQTLADTDNLPGFLNFAKLRASYAEVGKDAGVYLTGIYYDQPSNFPFGEVDGFSQDSNGGSDKLKPERTAGLEFGGEFRFLQNRFGFDLTYYQQNSKDQIFNVPAPQSSGFDSFTLNTGEVVNRGWEVLVNGTPLKTSNFSWDLTLNWSKVKGEVLSLPEQIDEVVFADSGFGVVSKLVVGGSPGDLYGFTYSYDENGNRIIAANGFPLINTSQQVKVGNAFPDWLGSVQSSFNWKGLSLSFLLERKEGGDAYDSGQRNGLRNGVLKITEFRNEEMVFEGVLADGTPNTTPVNITQNYYRSASIYNRASEILVQDTSWWRLRNVTLSYELPSKLIDNTGIDRIFLNFTGTNLWLKTDFRGYDPEGTQFSAGTNAYGFTGLNIPNTKSYFFGINLNF